MSELRQVAEAIEDGEMAAELNISLDELHMLSAEKRADLERLVRTGRELDLYEAGLGPVPAGVIVNRGRSRWYNKDRVR